MSKSFHLFIHLFDFYLYQHKLHFLTLKSQKYHPFHSKMCYRELKVHKHYWYFKKWSLIPVLLKKTNFCTAWNGGLISEERWRDDILVFPQCIAQVSIDDLYISHNASGMEANIRVLLICNSSSHSSLVRCQRLAAPVLSGNIVFYETM